MPSGEWTLAIDFGTTATSAATLAGGEVQVVRIDSDDRMPSMVFWREPDGEKPGELLLGDVADRWAPLAPDCLERAPKRRIGDRFLKLGSAEIRVTDAIGAILRKVADAATATRGTAPAHVRLTHPARWAQDGPELDQLREAARIAGLPEPSFVAEPVAAAIHFATAELAVGEFVAVYDFGGGTFDTAVLQRVDGGFEVVGEPGGDEQLGGQDFDDRLYRFLGSRLEPQEWERLRTSRDSGWPQANRELLREARRAKEHLSHSADAPVWVPSPVNRDILVNAEQLRELIADDVESTVDELERTIRHAGLEPAELAAVYIAGGSSRIPLVASMISERLGKVPQTLDDPKTVVARGAARAAIGVNGGRGVTRPAEPSSARVSAEATPVAAPPTPLSAAAAPVTAAATPVAVAATPVAAGGPGAPGELGAASAVNPAPAARATDATELDLSGGAAWQPPLEEPRERRDPKAGREPFAAAGAAAAGKAAAQAREAAGARLGAGVTAGRAWWARATQKQRIVAVVALLFVLVGIGVAASSGGGKPGGTTSNGTRTTGGTATGGGTRGRGGSGGGTASTYPAGFAAEYAGDCTGNGYPATVCSCEASKIENSVTYTTFNNSIPLINSRQYPTWYVAAVTQCGGA